MTRPLELVIFASFYTKLGKNTPYNKNKNIKYFVYSTSYSSLTHKQILKSDLQSDLPFVVGAQKNPLIKMVLSDLKCGSFFRCLSNFLVGWSPRVVPFMKILSDSWAKSSHILQQ